MVQYNTGYSHLSVESLTTNSPQRPLRKLGKFRLQIWVIRRSGQQLLLYVYGDDSGQKNHEKTGD